MHKAFTGELTEKWRKEHGKVFGRGIKKFNEIAEVKSNLVFPEDYQDDPHIAPDNIEKKTGRLLEYRTIREDGVKSPKHRFNKGQIIYSKIRPYLSKVIIAPFDGLCSADMYPIETTQDTKYLWYFMLSEQFLVQASNSGSRSVLPKINQKELGRIEITVFPKDEEEEIARILDSVFEDFNNIDDTVQSILESIESTKKSVLGQVFRGNIVS